MTSARHGSLLRRVGPVRLIGLLALVPIAVLSSGTSAAAAACDGEWRVERAPYVGAPLLAVASPGHGEVFTLAQPFVTRAVISHRIDGRWTSVAFSNAVISGIDAAGTSAWAVGSSVVGSLAGMFLQWTGERWKPWNVPGSGALSPFWVHVGSERDVWVLATNLGGFATVLHFDGSRWRQTAFPDSFGAFTMAEVSPTDVWLLGNDLTSTCAESPAGAWHFNGTTWRRAILPCTATEPLGATDVTRSGTIWTTEDVSQNGVQSVGRHTPAGWSFTAATVKVAPALVTSAWNATAVVASDAPNGTTLVGYSTSLDGLTNVPQVQTWTGLHWARQPLHGLPPGSAALYAVDGFDHGNRYAVGERDDAAGIHPLFVHQCFP